jgi:type VI secretion system protein ImpH
MASNVRRRNGTVRESLLQNYRDFNVFQLMRLLLADAKEGMPMERRLRFRADLSAAFPASEFSRITLRPSPVTEDGEDAQIAEISTANFCIASVLGPLPEPFTEWMRDLAAMRSTAMADFLDIFNQRANILRFRLKQALNLGLQSVAPEETEVAYGLSALMGMALPQLAQQVPLPAHNWLGMAGLMANRRKQASTIEQVLSLAVGSQVRLIPYVGAWFDIDLKDRCALGQRNHQLGRSSIIGRRVWDQQARVRLAIGPIDYVQLCHLLPPTRLQLQVLADEIPEAYPPKTDFYMFSGLLKLLVDRLADCEIELTVSSASIPPVGLAQPARQTDFSSMRLGQSAWLRSRPGNAPATRRIRYLIRTTDSQGLA